MFILSDILKFIIIVFCMTLSLTSFLVSDNLAINIKTIIWNEAKPLFWWDIKIQSSNKLNNNQINYLNELKDNKEIILSKKIQTYSTILDTNNNTHLVSLLFVDEKYPLYWKFEIQKINDKEWIIISKNINDIFINAKFIKLFKKKYNISWIINKIPENWINFYDNWKKIVLNYNEFEKLNIDKLWARISREYLIKVNNNSDFKNIYSKIKENNLFEWIRVNEYKEWWDRFSKVFSELDNYIKYILIISFILTILIIFFSIESFYIWNKKYFSILKILWLKNKNLIFFNLILFISIFVTSIVISLFLSESIFYIIRKFELSKNFYLDSISIIKTTILWITILSISIILPLLKIFTNNPLAWLKENFLQIYSKKEIYIETILIITWIIFIYNLIIWEFINSILFTLALITWVLIIWYISKKLLSFIFKKSNFLEKKNFSIYDSIRNTTKPWNLSILIIFAYIISFTSLFFISIISINFFEKLNLDLNNENNIYIININDTDITKIDKNLKNKSYSVILWRILKINNKNIKDHIPYNWEWRLFTREYNITDNKLKNIKILKWKKINSWEVSLDYNFSKSLNLDLWDEIEFFIYWKKKKLIVANIRESSYETINPFFYFQVHENDFKLFPKNYFLTTYIQTNQIKQFKNDFLNKTWNHISFIEIDEVLKEIKSISKKVFLTIQILFTYIFIFCTISLIISIIFLIPFKKKKSKLYNILWANEKFIKTNNLFEYIYLQTLSFIISIIIWTIWSYFILNSSDFINFSIYSYSISLLLITIIFILLSLIINFLLKKINN